MGQRRILVIGSQCQALGRLIFLPQAAQDLYEVMTDSNLGGCVSALDGRAGLLIDPSVEDAKDAIKTAYGSAAQDEATLFIAYIGHGDHLGDDFYLLPNDAQLVASFSRSSNLSVIRAGTGFVIGEGRSVRVQMFGLIE